MTPDKIYVASGTTGIGCLCGLWFAEMESDLPQYIRKDALLEWLEKKVPLSYGLATDAFIEIIDKLNSL